jgi:hypothetical protein
MTYDDWVAAPGGDVQDPEVCPECGEDAVVVTSTYNGRAGRGYETECTDCGWQGGDFQPEDPQPAEEWWP